MALNEGRSPGADLVPAPLHAIARKFTLAEEDNRLLRAENERLRAERDSARHLAKHLFQMIDRETWRDLGGDDGHGHYEGYYHAALIEEEIRSWENA